MTTDSQIFLKEIFTKIKNLSDGKKGQIDLAALLKLGKEIYNEDFASINIYLEDEYEDGHEAIVIIFEYSIGGYRKFEISKYDIKKLIESKNIKRRIRSTLLKDKIKKLV